MGLFEIDGGEEWVAVCLPGNFDQNPSFLVMTVIPSRLLVWLPAPSFLFFSFSFSFLFFSSFWKPFTFPLSRPPLSFLAKL